MGFDYHRPSSVAEALQLATDLDGHRFIAGGTDLLVQFGRSMPGPVISLMGLGELREIVVGDRLRIGATVPLTDLARHPAVRTSYPALVESIDVLGSPQIRNVATLGGNLCNASPAADTAPPLLVYDAGVEVLGTDGTKVVPVSEFFLGPGETCLAAGEIVSAVLLDAPHPGVESVFLRRGRVRMDLAIASVAAAARVENGAFGEVRLAAGAVATTPLRLRGAEAILEGAGPDPDTIARAIDAARSEIAPITDLRATAEYRRHLTGVLLGRALTQIVEAVR